MVRAVLTRIGQWETGPQKYSNGDRTVFGLKVLRFGWRYDQAKKRANGTASAPKDYLAAVESARAAGGSLERRADRLRIDLPGLTRTPADHSHKLTVGE